jgi:integrase
MMNTKHESEEMTMNMKNGEKETKKRKPKASNNGSGRAFKRGKYWAYEIRRQYWDGNKTVKANRYCGHFKTKTEADKARFAAIEELEKEIEAGKRGELAARGQAKMTFGEIGNEFLTIHELKWGKKTKQYMRTNLQKCEAFFDREWDGITMTEFQGMINVGGTYDTAKKMKLLLTGMQKCAFRYYPLLRNFVSDCELPPETIAEKRVFEKGERDLLWKVVNRDSGLKGLTEEDRMAASALLIMIHSGMRPGELRNVDPVDIDLVNHRIHKGGIKTKRGKTGSIFVVSKIVPLVREWMMPKNRFSEVSIETIRDRADKLQDKLGMPHHVLSSCRTTTATVLAEMKTSADDLQTIMRHTSIAVTRKYYDKSGDENAIEALSRLDGDDDERKPYDVKDNGMTD